LWAKEIHDGLARRLHEGGFASLGDAVGSAIARPERPSGQV
jgi:dihydroorotate dehydrogenase